MSDALREAARRALERRAPSAGPSSGADEPAVRRLTLDVAVDGRDELVTIALRDGELVWSSSGDPDGPHVAAALRWIAAGGAVGGASVGAVGGVGGEPASPMRITDAGDASVARLSWPSPADLEADGGDAPSARVRLAEALDDVVTVVVRAGASALDSPSISESLERLRREAPLPTPTGLARWLGRLREGLDRGDVPLVARLLEGASTFAADLRRERPTVAVRRRVVGWTGVSEVGAVERLSDRTLLEVAREPLASSERGGFERRYLVDLQNGEVFREERSRSSPVASVGPCPRVVSVGLAEVEDGATPRRIRLMQYVVTLGPGREEIARVEANAYRRFSALPDRYREAILEHPGQAEPFAVVAPSGWSNDGGPVCHDDDGDPLPFATADDPAAVEVLGRVVPEQGPRWVAGRLVDGQGTLLMVPCAVAVETRAGVRLHRLR